MYEEGGRRTKVALSIGKTVKSNMVSFYFKYLIGNKVVLVEVLIARKVMSLQKAVNTEITDDRDVWKNRIYLQ